MGSGANPGGFLSGLWGVVGPQVEAKYKQKLELQTQEKLYEQTQHQKAMQEASDKLYGPNRDPNLSPEDAAQLTQQFKFSREKLDKLLGTDKQIGPQWKKFSGAVTKLITAPNSRKQKLGGPQTQAPQQQQQAAAASGAPGAQPGATDGSPEASAEGAPAASGAAASGAPGGTQLPGPQTPPPEEAQMRETALASTSDDDHARTRRERYAEKFGKDWTSKEKADFVEGRQFPTQGRPTVVKGVKKPNQEESDKKTYTKIETPGGEPEWIEEAPKAGKAHNMMNKAARYADGSVHQIWVDPQDPANPEKKLDADTGEPIPRDAVQVSMSELLSDAKLKSYGPFNFLRMAYETLADPNSKEPDRMAAQQYITQQGNIVGLQVQRAHVITGTEGVDAPGVKALPTKAPPAAQPQGQPPQPTPPGGGQGAGGASPTPAPAKQFAPLSGANAPKDQAAPAARPPAGAAGGQGPANAGPARPQQQPATPAPTPPLPQIAAAAGSKEKPALSPDEQTNVDAWVKSATGAGKFNNRAQMGLKLAIKRTGLDANDLTTAAINHQDLAKTLQNTYGRMSAYTQLQDVVSNFGDLYVKAAKEWKSMTKQPLENATIQAVQQLAGDHPDLQKLLVATDDFAGAYGRVRAAAPQSAAMPSVSAMESGTSRIKPSATLNVMKASVDQVRKAAVAETDAMRTTIEKINEQLQTDPIAKIYGIKKVPMQLGAPKPGGPSKTTLDTPDTGKTDDEVVDKALEKVFGKKK